MDRSRHGLYAGRRGRERGRGLRLWRLLIRLLRGLLLGHRGRGGGLLLSELGRHGDMGGPVRHRRLSSLLLLRHGGRWLRGRGLPVLLLRRLLLLLPCGTSGGTLLHFAQGRDHTGHHRSPVATLLRIERKVKLDARLATAIRLVLARAESSAQLLKQSIADLNIATVVRLIGSVLVLVHPEGSTVRTVVGLLLLGLGIGH